MAKSYLNYQLEKIWRDLAKNLILKFKNYHSLQDGIKKKDYIANSEYSKLCFL